MNSIRTYCFIWIFIGMTPWILACAAKTADTTKKTAGKVHQVTIDADSNANMGSPVVVDIVSTYDDQLVRALESSAASDWFASKKKYIDQFEGKIFVISREIAPGNQIQLEYTTEIDEKPIATFIFASYDSAGEGRIKVEKFEPLVIKLEEKEFLVTDE